MKLSTLSAFLAAGILAGTGSAGFSDDDEKKWRSSDHHDSVKDSKDRHKEYNKEQKEWHKERSKDKDWHKDQGDRGRHLGWYKQGRGEDRRDHSERGHGDWQWQRRGDNWRYQDNDERKDYGRDKDHNRHGDHPDRDRYGYDRSERDHRYSDRNQSHPNSQHWDRDHKEKDRNTVGFSRPLANTNKIHYNQLPSAVQRTVQQQARGAAIEDVEVGTLDGRHVYEVAFKHGGVHNELRVYENGAVLQRIAGNNIQFPGTLRLSDVPPSVQRAIRDRIGSAEINDIDRMNLNGRVVYEVGFKRADGIQREMQFAETGAVINEAAGAETHR